MISFHPRDFDGGQPMLEGLPIARKFKSYVGVKGAAAKVLNPADLVYPDCRRAMEKEFQLRNGFFNRA